MLRSTVTGFVLNFSEALIVIVYEPGFAPLSAVSTTGAVAALPATVTAAILTGPVPASSSFTSSAKPNSRRTSTWISALSPALIATGSVAGLIVTGAAVISTGIEVDENQTLIFFSFEASVAFFSSSAHSFFAASAAF